MRFPRRVAVARSQMMPTCRPGRSWLRGSRLGRWSVLTMLPGLLGLVLLVGTPAPSSATPGVNDYPSWLMKRPKDGYVDPWNFYSRECTSFVAWRLNNDNGVRFTNQYLGHHWGNAGIWKRAAQDSGVKVDDTPVVGAVAWWSASSTSGGLGHVAWVYKTDGSSITVEEYNYLRSGYYDQRVINRGDRHWPDGFIHVADLALTNRVAPYVSGTAQVGKVLTAHRGAWSRTGLTYRFQWQAGNQNIQGATGRRFRVGADQLGKRIRVRVSVTAPGVAGSSMLTARTSRVIPGVLGNSAAPTVSGDVQVGGTLTADPGSWSPTANYSYQWLVDGQPVDGAITSTYSPQPADVGHVVSVTVTATKAGYGAQTATSAVTAAVAPGEFALGSPPSISGTPQVDQQLTATPGGWTPTAKYAYQWYADGAALPGATGRTFSPGAAQVGRVLSVGVTGTRSGYAVTPRQSAGTARVRAGEFTRLARPKISGTAQVGEQLTASPGSWLPDPSAGQIGVSPYRFQWLAAGQPIAGATGDTFTPTAAEVGRQLSVRVTATRPGYAPDKQVSTATTAVAPGQLGNQVPPTVTGDAFVGQSLTADPGTWTTAVSAADLHYRWLADGRTIQGADQPTLVLTRSQLGQEVRVRVTASPAGYVSASAESTSSAAVLRGQAGFTGSPRVTGRTRPDSVLTAVTGDFTPPWTTPHYQWFRQARAIAGAKSPTYTTGPRDLGHSVSVRISLTPHEWAPTTFQTEPTARIQAFPRMPVDVHVTRRHNARVEIHFSAEGVRPVGGRVRIRDGSTFLASVRVVDDVARRWIGPLATSTHQLTLDYTGSWRVAPRTRVVDVRVR